MQNLFECLAEYGLSDKESKVYLAMLELGPSSVQDIAQKAGVNRATTYVMLEALKRRGLMSTFDKGKKTMFVAESPEMLKRINDEDLHTIEAKNKRLQEMLPSFLALYQSPAQDRPTVRFFEGEEGFAATRDLYAKAKGEILTFTAIDENLLRASKIDENRRMEINDEHFGRDLLAIKTGYEIPRINQEKWQVRSIPYASKPFTGEMIIFNDCVSLSVWNEQPTVVVIENKAATDIMRAIYEFSWANARPI